MLSPLPAGEGASQPQRGERRERGNGRRRACEAAPGARPEGRRRHRALAATIALSLVLAALPACIRGGTGDRPPSPTDPELTVELSEGVTPLTELGAYRVAYQLYGAPRVEMPASWSGHFTDDVGIAFYDAGHHGGRRAHVLHCPWRAGAGLVSLEYHLAVPRLRPVTLRFGIAMRPDITTKSDGVTFSAFVVGGEERVELFREHYTAAEWKDFTFDLSPHAGTSIIVGFQAEPGPKNDSSFDFSLLGEPTLTVGRAIDTRAQLLGDITRSGAYIQAARSDLTKLANDRRLGIVPGTSDRHTTRVEKLDGGYAFHYRGADCRIVYTVPLTANCISELTAQVDSSPAFRPCHGAGIQLAAAKTPNGAGRRPDAAALVSHEFGTDSLTVLCRYGLDDVQADVAWTFRLRGKALTITAQSTSAAVAHLSLGRPWTKGLRRTIAVPYLSYASAYFLRPQNVYVMSYLDWTKSRASRTPGGEAAYLPRVGEARNPLHEEGYIAVSPELGEVLPNIPHPPSPFIEQLAGKIVLDIWGGTYDKGATLLRELKSTGVDHAAVIWHVWQRFGYDVKLPDHLPADPRLGGDEAMKRLAAAAREVGYPFSLHENYIDFYPDAPSWNPTHVVLTPKGEFSKAWYHRGTKVQSYALKAGQMLHYAAQNSPEIHRRFGTTAAYLDVHTCVPPWHHVDYDPKTELAGSHHLKVQVHARLFQYERDVHQGPLFGEGSNHFFWAGLVDGVEAQVGGGEDRELLLDFDLLKVHPQMVNHGMGYYTRWLRTGRQTRWGVEAPTPAQLDKYRVTTLAYGHAGFVGSQTAYVPHLVWREHNLVAPVQALYGAAKATEILYDVGGQLVTASAAIPCGALDRVRVVYDSGLRLHVNLRNSDWHVGGHIIPLFGFLAVGPDLLAYTARRSGVIADYAEDATTLFADARTHVYRPWEHGLRKIEPSLRDFKHLGDGRFAITYAWAVDEALDDDYTTFVHFIDPDGNDSEGIRFQDDHVAKQATSTWEPGRLVVEGPHQIEVPADQEHTAYDIVVGLYKPGSDRLHLRGIDVGSRRVLIGRLAVERDAGEVVGVKLLPIEERRKEQAALRRKFDERMNVERKLVDFGKVHTDGSFKLYKRDGALTLLPYPREADFTIKLNVAQLLPGRRPAAASVVPVTAAGARLKALPTSHDERWLVFRAGTPKAVRYEITFP